MKFTIGAWRGRGRKKKMRREGREEAPKTEEETPRDVAVVETEMPVATSPQRQQPDDRLCFGVIELKEGKDDGVSLISEPYFGDAGNALVDAGNTVGESVLSSQQGLYAYGLLRPRADTGAESTLGEGATVVSGRLLFGEDATLEDRYRSPPGPRRFRVVAPPGKLGIVVDNPRGDVPVVHAVKETSPLHGQVRVDDLVLSVDEADCAGMSAHRLSAFLNSRSQNPTRTLLLARVERG